MTSREIDRTALPATGRGLHRAARIAMVIGAVGSVGLTVYAGRHNASLLVRGLVVAWVAAPFLVFALASKASKRWTVRSQTWLQWTILVLATSIVVIFGIAVLSSPMPRGFVFVAVPPAWCLLAAIVAAVGAAKARSAHRGDA